MPMAGNMQIIVASLPERYDAPFSYAMYMDDVGLDGKSLFPWTFMLNGCASALENWNCRTLRSRVEPVFRSAVTDITSEARANPILRR